MTVQAQMHFGDITLKTCSLPPSVASRQIASIQDVDTQFYVNREKILLILGSIWAN